MGPPHQGKAVDMVPCTHKLRDGGSMKGHKPYIHQKRLGEAAASTCEYLHTDGRCGLSTSSEENKIRVGSAERTRQSDGEESSYRL